MSYLKLKCKKCRSLLTEDLPNSPLVSAHCERLNTRNIWKPDGHCSMKIPDVFYIQESDMPQWINEVVNEAGWLKGKLSCPHCSARLGSFDFVSGSKCECQMFLLPPVHLIRRKVDYNVT